MKSSHQSNSSIEKTQITIRIDQATIEYFKNLSDETGMPYQNLINLFLRECVNQKQKPIMQWSTPNRESTDRLSDNQNNLNTNDQ